MSSRSFFLYSTIYTCIYLYAISFVICIYTFYVSSFIWPLCARWTLSQTHYQWNMSLLIVRIASQSIIFTFHFWYRDRDTVFFANFSIYNRCCPIYNCQLVEWCHRGFGWRKRPKRNIIVWWINANFTPFQQVSFPRFPYDSLGFKKIIWVFPTSTGTLQSCTRHAHGNWKQWLPKSHWQLAAATAVAHMNQRIIHSFFSHLQNKTPFLLFSNWDVEVSATKG